MKKLLLISSMLLSLYTVEAQNLVYNGSFEMLDSCPNNWDEIHYAKGWFAPTGQIPDLFNSCDTTNFVGIPNNQKGWYINYQYAKDGQSMGGLYYYIKWPDWVNGGWLSLRDYMGDSLISLLTIGKRYKISYYINNVLGSSDIEACNNYGVAFTTFKRLESSNTQVMNLSPLVNDTSIVLDTLNWTLIEGTFIADSAYQYIYFGNFFDNTHSKTTLNPFSSTFYYYIDDIHLEEYPFALGEEQMTMGKEQVSIYPNPCRESLVISQLPLGNTIRIYDLMGREIYCHSERSEESKSIAVSVGKLKTGVYFIKVIDKNGNVKCGKFIKE